MAATDYISFRRLSQFWDKVKQYIADKIAEIIQPAPQKEIINVLTYSSSAPSSPSDGDYYINSSSDKLYKYSSSSWSEATAKTDVIYIALDTAHIYVYSGSEFVDTTGEMVDNTIYINNIETDLDDYIEDGVYNVCIAQSGVSEQEWYTFTVTVFTPRGAMISIHDYTQVLHNNNGYKSRKRTDRGSTTGTWSSWSEFTYASTDDIEKLKPLIYAGL